MKKTSPKGTDGMVAATNGLASVSSAARLFSLSESQELQQRFRQCKKQKLDAEDAEVGEDAERGFL